jgi:hypothetical protein
LFGDSTATNGYGIAIDTLIRDTLRQLGCGVIEVVQGAVSGTQWATPGLAETLTGYGRQMDLAIFKFGTNDAGAPPTTIESAVTQLRNAMSLRLQQIRASTYGGAADLSILLMMPAGLADPDNNKNNLWLNAIRGVYKWAANKYLCCVYDPYLESQGAVDGSDTFLDEELVHSKPNYSRDIWGRALQETCAIFGSARQNAYLNLGFVQGFAPAASAGIALYNRGSSDRRAQFADGWPDNGLVHTVWHADNLGYQRWTGFAEDSQTVDRVWLTGSNTWGPWSVPALTTRTAAQGFAPAASGGLSQYPRAFSSLRARLSDGWPDNGLLLTHRHPDNIAPQELVTFTGTRTIRRVRHWITASNAWSSWV